MSSRVRREAAAIGDGDASDVRARGLGLIPAPTPDMSSKKRLSRLVIGEAALTVADRDGLERVSMRSVAAELDAAPMAIYRHFRNKAALLDYMLERVLERVFVNEDVPPLTWEAAVTGAAWQARRVLGMHPSWLPLLTRTIAPASAVAVFERIVIAMAKDRISPATKLHAITSLMCFTLGFVLVERMMKPAGGEIVPIEQLRRAREAGFAGFPRLAGLADSFEAWSFDAAFESGLRALVSEIHRKRAAS